jgi:hypothetical protein
MQLLICEHSSDKVRADQHPDGQKATKTGDEAGIRQPSSVFRSTTSTYGTPFVAAHHV